MHMVSSLMIGSKKQVSNMLTKSVINFSTGSQQTANELQLISNTTCRELSFAKVWLDQGYLCKVGVEVEQESFILKVLVNGKSTRIVLDRGTNVLCERYNTIWPTIRYLVHKKLGQFSALKPFNSHLFRKKMPEGMLGGLECEMFSKRFG